MHTLSRRQFSSLLLGGTCALTVRGDPPAAPRLAVSTWSFHNYFPNTRYGTPQYPLETWTVRDVLRRVRERLGIDAFELSSAHLTSLEPAYLDELRAYAREQRVQLIHMSDNMPGVNQSHAEPREREAALRRFEQLIDATQRLGIPTMRVNTGTPPRTPEWDMNITIESYRRLARYGRARQVEIIIENHFGISADPRNVARIIEAVGENISACPDFGLLPNNDMRWDWLGIMIRHARRVCSAKFHGLTEQNEHRDFDLRRCYRLLREGRFAGWVSLEYEGNLEPMAQLVRMQPLARRWLGGDV